MSNRTQIDTHTRDYTAPLPGCPAWCEEHTHEVLAEVEPEYDHGEAKVWDQHRRVLSVHHWPVYYRDGDRGVRELAIEQSGFDGRFYAPQVELTLFPHDPERYAAQKLNVRQLRELIDAAGKAIEILEAAQR